LNLVRPLLMLYAQTPLDTFLRSKSVTSCRWLKSVVSVVSCRFPNSITATCCQLVTDLETGQTIWTYQDSLSCL